MNSVQVSSPHVFMNSQSENQNCSNDEKNVMTNNNNRNNNLQDPCLFDERLVKFQFGNWQFVKPGDELIIVELFK